jgi:cytochrome c-type protein NapC
MGPAAAAYRADLHGGASSHGVIAVCTSCHLPHDGPARYLIAKARTGLHDVWVELTTDSREIDWLGMRERREHFVYDSGCLTCHKALETATRSNSRAFVAHKPYFLGQIEKQCVSCHPAVGHANLEVYLRASSSHVTPHSPR